MERKAFVLRLKEGMKQEYIRRHERLWPEMRRMLQDAGVTNYSIWWYQDLLFGYYEAENIRETEARKRVNPVQGRWNAYMADLIAPDDGQTPPEQVFFLA